MITKAIMKKLLALMLLAAAALSAQQAAKPDQFSFHQHIPLAAVPTSSTTAISPSPGPAGITLTGVYFVNTNATTAVTVTVTCITSSVVLFEAVIQGVNVGGNNLPLQFPADGIWCAGGVSWQASGSGVNGTISARY